MGKSKNGKVCKVIISRQDYINANPNFGPDLESKRFIIEISNNNVQNPSPTSLKYESVVISSNVDIVSSNKNKLVMESNFLHEYDLNSFQ